MMEVKPVHRIEFAEVAEALSLNTDQIRSQQPEGQTLLVLFNEGPVIWGATLRRDARGILHELSRAEFTHEQYVAAMGEHDE